MTWTERKEALRQIVGSTLGNRAPSLLSVSEPFTFTGGETLSFEADGSSVEVDFGAMTNATAVDVAALIEFADAYWGKVRLQSSRYCGADSRLQVADTDANAVLQFDTSLQQGDGLLWAMVRWAGEAQPDTSFSESAKVQLDVIADRPAGSPFQVKNQNGSLELIWIQQRIMKLSVQAECLTHIGDKFAFRWLTQVSHFRSREITRALLEAANISVLSVGEVIKLPNFVVDEREYSKANVDLELNYIAEETDETFSGDWIETVEIDSAFLTHENPIVVEYP